jgi:hypothetical protein
MPWASLQEEFKNKGAMAFFKIAKVRPILSKETRKN